ncbi:MULTISPECIES: hypothetical protein [unclassified Paracoccus (in: a-proteobacteria)]|nr:MULTISPECIES: hypothetical protein [unclassified Paracoccus (in: a-proteobacteria)]UXU76010.1 hypothetical protein GB879_005890 [Paracoccus sp. SMMA_5]UXU81920.1 hypothetical protein GB880_005875 [Paracoccus sp. SMMA_5_TC]
MESLSPHLSDILPLLAAGPLLVADWPLWLLAGVIGWPGPG